MTIPDTLSLTLSRVFDAPRENVFRAFADPERMRRWMGPRPASLDSCEMDFREGGRYRFGFDIGSGSWLYVVGTFETIKAPEKLVFTWRWETPNPDEPTMLVSLDFIERDGQTELILVHERFVTDAQRELHAAGWEGCLASLGRALAEDRL